MTKIIRTEIAIEATLKQVWDVLIDFPLFLEWNPFIKTIIGKASLGEKLKVSICPPGGDKMEFTPRIIEMIPNQKLIWKGKLLISGLFDGVHKFILESADEGTKFIHEETFSGLLVHLFPNSIYEKTQSGFKQMNEALKRRCEALEKK